MKTIVSILLTLALSFTAMAFDKELSWRDNSGNEDGFKVERAIDGIDFIEIGTVGPDIVKYSDLNVPVGVDISYRVRAFNEYGNSGYTNTAVTNTKGPAAPSDLTVGIIAAAGAGLLIVFLAFFVFFDRPGRHGHKSDKTI